LPAVRNGLGRAEHTHDPICAARHVWAMSGADASHPKLAPTLVDEPFIVDIEVCGALVKEKNAGLSIQGARKQHPLLLASRERATHVADETIVGHRHRHDLFVDARQGRTLDHSQLVE
jgi:hypothetical protein